MAHVIYSVARTRGGEGPPWGFTVMPLVGDTCRAMQPQVTLTSGRAHTRAAPQVMPQVIMYYYMYVKYVVSSLEQVPMCVMGLHGHGQGAQHLLHTLSP